MRARILALALVGAVAACGDAPGPPAICELPGYPPKIAPQTITLAAAHALALDGNGTRCDQLLRALVDPVGRPPELAGLDAATITGSCVHDSSLDRDVIRLYPQSYGGQPLIQPSGGGPPPNRQNVLAHVDGTTVVYLAGTVWPAGAAPEAGCIEPSAVLPTVPSRPMTYLRYRACQPQGTGEYPVAADDELAIGDRGLYLTAAYDLRWVVAVDVWLVPGHVTAELINSDAYCCPEGLAHCVGKRLIIDTHTGELVAQEPHCLQC